MTETPAERRSEAISEAGWHQTPGDPDFDGEAPRIASARFAYIFSAFHTEKGEHVFENDVLHDQLQQLVNEYGLDHVYFTLRSFDGYCQNCGTPLREGEPHQPMNLGWCEVPIIKNET